MNLDDVLRLAAERPPSQLELAQTRRTAQRIRQEHARARTEGRNLIEDLDLGDPLAAQGDEADRIRREAQMGKLGTFTWWPDTERVTWSVEMSLILGHPSGMVRPPHHLLFDLIHPEDLADVRQTLNGVWTDRRAQEATFRVIRPDRVVRYVHCYLEIVEDATGTPYGVVGTGADITALELARQERRRLARRDASVSTARGDRCPITGLVTRQRFLDEIDNVSVTGSGTLLVLAVEPVGPQARNRDPAEQDRLSATVAGVIRGVARRTDVCAVVGPGEYGVLMHRTSMAAARSVAETIVDRLRAHPIVVGHRRLRLEAWGGLVRYDQLIRTSGFDLLLDAGTGWRRARNGAAPAVAITGMVSGAERQERCRAQIRAAVAAERFTLFAQPLLDVNLNQITRHEILLRVLDRTDSPVLPSVFLDIAERMDEMLPVDRWVVDRAMKAIADGPRTAHYQINLSGRTVGDPALLEHVDNLIGRLGVDPNQITFEITETALIGNLTLTRTFANGVKEIGCHLALDDFGAGYASFAYLKYFSIDLVKIDGSFISGIHESATDQCLVRSLVAVCRELGIRTAAEYVEDARTLGVLRELGVDFAQGYLIGVPRPVGRPPVEQPVAGPGTAGWSPALWSPARVASG